MALNQNDDLVTTGGCFCGAVRYHIKGPPLTSGYCHCTICQRLHGAPFIHSIHWVPLTLTWDATSTPEPPQDKVDSFTEPEKPLKHHFRCKACGTPIACTHSGNGSWAVWGGSLDRNEDGKMKNAELYKALGHWFYGSRAVDVDDGLVKWEGFEGISKVVG